MCQQQAVIVSYEPPMSLSISSLIAMGDNFHLNLHVNATGDVLHITAYSGDCTAYHDLPPDGSIPPPAAIKILCGSPWSNRVATASRGAGDLFYEKRTSQSLHVGEWSNGLVDHGATGSVNPDWAVLALTHDDTVLIEGGQNGVLATYTVSGDGLTLTLAATLDIASTQFFQAGIVVPCD